MLEKIFSSRIGVKVLIEIGRKPYKEFYLNELSKNLKIGLGRTKTILDDLVREGILVKNNSGNRILYRLNSNNILSFEIVKFANLDSLLKVPEKFRTAINNSLGKYEEILGENLVSVVIFGSVATGEAKAWSDIDIFILVKRGLSKNVRDKVLHVFFEISDVFSQISEEHIYTEDQFINGYEIGNDFLINVMKSGIIVYDRNNFFAKFLLKGIPGVTRKSIEKRLKIAKEWLDSSFEFYRKNLDVESQLGTISIHLSSALLLLNHIIPESKYDVPKKLENMGEHKFAKIYRKTRKWFDSPPLKANKEETWEILSFLKEKYNYCRRRLEVWS